ncbi:phosphoglycerate mutase [Escherichia coli]|uniref:Phosphoglycerate mutase n=1 Tax=Escherichia coli TaxID=562 RepID=A0A376RPQ3_ECOLX|nr:phosphoglycerate mutase [Escherichia coli]
MKRSGTPSDVFRASLTAPLTAKGEQQAMQVATRAKELGITHIISSDLGRTRRTAEIIAQACGCDIIFDSPPA